MYINQSNPVIDVRIPFEPGKQLGFAYNRAMETIKDWVLFLDHDVLLCNPAWYTICQEAIKQVGHKAGFITCMTNRIGNSAQQDTRCRGHDIKQHLLHSVALQMTHKGKLQETSITDTPFSGFLILTHKQAWKDAGGFTDGFLGVDNAYYRAVSNAGYKTYIIRGLYAYHIYRLKLN